MVSALTPTLARPECSDARDLLGAARSGDADAFCEVCQAYEGRLLRQAMTLCGNATVAEELAQDTLVEAWKCIRRYNGRCQFFTWLCAILLNRHRNVLRQTGSGWGASAGDAARDDIAEAAVDESTPAQTAEARERAALMLRCIDSLPPKQQQVIYLRYYVEDSLSEIAGALGCSIGTVKSRLFYALENLRSMNALAPEGVSANLERSAL